MCLCEDALVSRYNQKKKKKKNYIIMSLCLFLEPKNCQMNVYNFGQTKINLYIAIFTKAQWNILLIK